MKNHDFSWKIMTFHEKIMTFREKSDDPPKIPTKIDENLRKSIFPNLFPIIPGVSPGFKNLEKRSKNMISDRFFFGFFFDPGSVPDDRASLN